MEIDVRYSHNKSSQGYRAQDIGNALSALKGAVDGMVDAGVIPNDSAKWLRWGGFEITTTRDYPEGVFVTVRA